MCEMVVISLTNKKKPSLLGSSNAVYLPWRIVEPEESGHKKSSVRFLSLCGQTVIGQANKPGLIFGLFSLCLTP